MAEAKKVILTNMCLVHDGSRVLIQIRSDKNYSGAIFPGGHVEDGESITASVIREVKEETGITVKAPQLCGIKNFYTSRGERYIVFLFKANEYEGELCSSDEGEALWIEESTLSDLETVSGFDELYRTYTSDKPSELWYHGDGFDII